jgi:hypothetical protein
LLEAAGVEDDVTAEAVLDGGAEVDGHMVNLSLTDSAVNPLGSCHRWQAVDREGVGMSQ